MIENHSCCYSCKINIPEGMITLETNFGKGGHMIEPGYRCCVCYYTRYPVMISLNRIRYCVPVDEIPTKDNVHVSINVGINFHIGRDETTYEADA